MNPLLDLKLVFVTGKGGVGKTTVASALALFASQQGKRVLICEVDAKGDVAGFYEAPPTGFNEKEILPGLFAMTMDTEASLREYLKLQLRIPVVGRIGPLAKAFDFVATAAPGVREILTVGKPVYEVRERNYDLVVVDAPASGHIIGLLAAPQAINNLVKVGLIRSQTDWLLEILSDPQTTGLVAVCTPEEMPVSETIELAARVKEETTVQLSAVVVNRVLPELFGRQEERGFDALSTPGPSEQLNRLVGGDAGSLLDAARLAVTMRRTRSTHLDRLRRGIDESVPMLYLPYLFTRSHGLRTTRQVAASWVRSWGTDGRPQPQRRPNRNDHAIADRGDRDTDNDRDRGGRPGRPAVNRRKAGQAKHGKAGSVAGRPAGGQGDRGGLRSGGVGKTTTAAAAAVMAAVRHGSKVLVLTVDPAKRLADALGLDGIGNTEHRVPDEAFRAAGIKPRGQLWAAMLDTRESWGRADQTARARRPDQGRDPGQSALPEHRRPLRPEPRLHRHGASVRDPLRERLRPHRGRHATDQERPRLPRRPQRMADFFSSRLLRWLIVPYRSRFVNLATKPFYQIADRILGTEFLADISEFFVLFQTMHNGFVERSESVGRLLSDRRTTFIVVSTLEAVPLARPSTSPSSSPPGTSTSGPSS